jgi:uroporphyrinogen decarboxylase
MAAAGGDVIGVDSRQSLADAWQRLAPGRAIQGNLDPARILAGWAAVQEGADEVLAAAGRRPGHIFNTGHAVPRSSDPGLLRALVDHVHEATAR